MIKREGDKRMNEKRDLEFEPSRIQRFWKNWEV